MVQPRIVWREAAPLPASARRVPWIDDAPGSAELLESIALAVSRVGVPEVAGAATPKEDAIGLLMLAAEVEHALMVQYLYAAQSVRGVAGRMISHVAVQEMGHLVTVQNLLLALEGVGADGIPNRIHLARDGLRRASSHNPLPLVLEPVSKRALAKFIIVERPASLADDALRARVEALEAEVAATGVDAHPVHALYAAVRWIFQEDDTDTGGVTAGLGFKPGWHLRDEDFVDPASTADFAAEGAEWGSVPGLVIAPVMDRRSALAAIDEVTRQGEGAPGTAESHFQDFLTVLDALARGTVNVTPLARTPYVDAQPAVEDCHAVRISHPYTALWARLFNAVYELLLVDITWALSQRRDGTARALMIDVCIDVMSQLIQPLAAHLARQPLAGGAEKAGPPYGLVREESCTTRDEFAQRYRVLTTERESLMAAISGAAEFGPDVAGRTLLEKIRRIDAQRLPHLP
jgi:hypothetical protein